MNRKTSINYLKKLYLLLYRLMGSTVLGTKYTKSLSRGIKSLERNDLLVENNTFKVKVKNTSNIIKIDVSHKNGELIETHKYDCNKMINEDYLGKT